MAVKFRFPPAWPPLPAGGDPRLGRRQMFTALVGLLFLLTFFGGVLVGRRSCTLPVQPATAGTVRR